jgi:transposase
MERNENLRYVWKDMVQNYIEIIPASSYVFVDETHIKKDDCSRKYGYSVKGTSAISNRWLHDENNANCTSGLVAIGLEGLMSLTVFGVEMTGDMFLNALRDDILVHMNPFPGVNSILVLDNAPTHFKNDIMNLCGMCGVLCNFLPPYSPDLNPVELCHHAAKQYIRDKFNCLLNPVEDQLVEAFHRMVTPEKVIRFYEHCGYPVTEQEKMWATR